jgi:hypothetical protein
VISSNGARAVPDVAIVGASDAAASTMRARVT